MDVAVNHLAVVLAALSTMAVGSLWYSPAGFYKLWARLAGVKPGAEPQGLHMYLLFGSVFVASLLMAYVLAVMAFLVNQFFQNSFFQDTIGTAFWLWLGFVATRFYVHDAFEGRDRRLTMLNGAHELVTLLVMALIIGLMGY